VAAGPKVVHISPDSELVLALRRAAVDREPVLVDTGEQVFEIGVVSSRPVVTDEDADEPDAILNLIDIVDTSEPSDIARYKDQYLADAINPRSR
jgi:hypothetical protein